MLKNVSFRHNRGQKINCLYFLALFSLFLSSAILCITNRAFASSILRSMFSCEAQGLGRVIPTIKVWVGQGTNLSFIPTGEIIKKVWLDDPSQIVLDFDGPICQQFGQQNASTQNCEQSAATVVHLRRIEKIDFPGIPIANNTLLTVITEGNDSKRKLYSFRVHYGKGRPVYNTLEILADPASGQEASCVKK